MRWGGGTTKELVKAQIPYNCFYKSFLLLSPDSLEGESLTEPQGPWP